MHMSWLHVCYCKSMMNHRNPIENRANTASKPKRVTTKYKPLRQHTVLIARISTLTPQLVVTKCQKWIKPRDGWHGNDYDKHNTTINFVQCNVGLHILFLQSRNCSIFSTATLYWATENWLWFKKPPKLDLCKHVHSTDMSYI